MLTVKQRFALASAVKLLQSILDEDDDVFRAPPKTRRSGTIRDISEKKQNILRDYNSGIPVKAISEKYNLTHQYIYSVIRKNKATLNDVLLDHSGQDKQSNNPGTGEASP